MNRQQELENTSIGRLLLKYSIPAIIGMLVNALYNVVDRGFIGNIPDVGNAAMAGVVITMPIVTIILGFSMFIGIGTTAYISIKLGEHQREEAEKALGNGFIIATFMALILMVLGLIFAPHLLKLFGGNEETIPYGAQYINIFLVGTLFNVLGFCFTSIMRADGSPKMSSVCMVIGCVLNIILDYVFVFVIQMGIEGAALATIISQAVPAIIGLWHFTKGKSGLKLRKHYFKCDLSVIKNIVAIGMAPATMQMAISLVQVVMNNVLNRTGGQVAVAAMGVISAVTMLVLMPIFGINQGAQPIIGYNYGAKNYRRAKETSILSMIAATIILTIGCIIIEIMPGFFVRIFDGTGEIAPVAVPGIRIYVLTLPILAVSIMGSNYFQAIGKAKVATVLSLLRQVLVLIPVIYIASSIGGLTGAWCAQPISDVICTVIVGLVLIKEFRSYKENSHEVLLKSQTSE